MRILRDKITKIVTHIFNNTDDIKLTSKKLITQEFSAPSINSTTHEIVQGSMPQLFVGGAMSFNGGIWTIEHQELYNNGLEIEKIKLCKIVDKKTNFKILNLASENKQRNYLAKYNELLEKKFSGVITADEITSMNTLKQLWLSIETLVNDGNAEEVEIMDYITIDQLY